MQKEYIDKMTEIFLESYCYALQEAGSNIQLAALAANCVVIALKDDVMRGIEEQNRNDIAEWVRESMEQIKQSVKYEKPKILDPQDIEENKEEEKPQH